MKQEVAVACKSYPIKVAVQNTITNNHSCHLLLWMATTTLFYQSQKSDRFFMHDNMVIPPTMGIRKMSMSLPMSQLMTIPQGVGT